MKYPMARWVVCLFLAIVQGGAWAGEPKPEIKLKDGDVVAVCGDSITSAGAYPFFMEIYGLVCGPKLELTFVNCGRWGQNAGDFPKSWDVDFVPAKPTVMTVCYGMNVGRWGGELSAGTLAKEAEALKTLIEKFKTGGGRVAVLGSPGCVDTEFHSKPEGANRNLAQLRDNARTVAGETGAVFADVHAPMVEVMARAKEKFGKEFAFAGGKGDGLHPGRAGHLVMAWVMLKALGYDGEIGTITVDLGPGGKATASDGHQVLSAAGGSVEIESSRYPFCFLPDPNRPKEDKSPGATTTVCDLFPFNQDLNRLMLVVKGGGAGKLKVTWGTQSKEFEAAALEKGVNLAAEFIENPFRAPFARILSAMGDRNNTRKWLAEVKAGRHKDVEQKRVDNEIEKLNKTLDKIKVVPVKHTLKIEPVK